MAKSRAKVVAKTKTTSDYSIYRFVTGPSSEAGSYGVFLSRQGMQFKRHFSFLAYGGEVKAMAMAKVYRDALVRIVPPTDTRVLHNTPSSRNTSGISGVSRIRNKSGYYWVATIREKGVLRAKWFSENLYGVCRAKGMATATRHRFFLEGRVGQFATSNRDATQAAEEHFGHSLPESPKPLNLKPILANVRRLDAWFDALRPLYAGIYAHIVQGSRGVSFQVALSSSSKKTDNLLRSWSVSGRRTREEVRILAWNHTKQVLTERYGPAWLKSFSRKYRTAFMAVDVDRVLQVRMLYVGDDAGLLRVPPSALAKTLSDLEINPR